MTSISLNNTNNYNLPKNPPKNLSPDQYLQHVMQETGKSESEAKALLQSTYGDPKAQQDESIFVKNNSSEDVNIDWGKLDDSDLSGLTGDYSNITSMYDLVNQIFGEDQEKNGDNFDPNKIAYKFSNYFGVAFDKARELLSKLFGKPQSANQEKITTQS